MKALGIIASSLFNSELLEKIRSAGLDRPVERPFHEQTPQIGQRRDPDMSLYGRGTFSATHRPKDAKCNVCHERIVLSISGALAVHPQRGWTMEAGRRFRCKGSNTRPAKPAR
jgi:hypothetical protein